LCKFTSGNTIVVGADGEASGVYEDENNNDAPYSGAVYVFVRDGDVWTQEAYFKGSNLGEYQQFGWSVSISGNTLVVGAFAENEYAGGAYVFVREGTTWLSQKQ
jgi:hypothetical protein